MARRRKGLNRHQKVAFKGGEHRVRGEEVQSLIEMAYSEDPAERLHAAENLCPCHVRKRVESAWEALYSLMQDADVRVRRAAWHTLEDGGCPDDPALILAGLQGISDEVIDSSLVDGCSGLRRIFAIDIPLILGQFKLIIVLAVIGGLQGWVAVFVMTAGGPGTASMVPGLWMYNNAFLWNKMGYASAIGMFLFVLIMGLTILNVKFVKTGDY